MDLKAVSKAIAGALVAALVGWLTAHNVIISPELNDALNVIIAAVIGFIGVYLAPRNQDGPRL